MNTEDSLYSMESVDASSQLAIHKAIYAAISDAVVFVDTKRHIVLMNAAANELFGYSLGEVQGKSTQIFYANPDDYGEKGEKHYSKYSARKSGAYENQYKRKDGSLFIGETLGSHVMGDNGKLLGYIGVVRDVTEHHKAFRLAERFGRVIEDSLNEVYLFDDDTLRFIDVNKGARQNLDYSIDELRKMTPYAIKPDHSEEAFKKMLIPLYNQSKKILKFETRHQRKDGSIYPIEVHLQRVNLDENYFFLAIILDITERKKTEQELDAHREHLEELVEKRSAVLKEQSQIINQIHDSVISTDLNGIILSWNNGATKLLGYTAEELLGKHISELYLEEDHDYLANQVIKPLKEKGEQEIEVRMRKKDASIFYALLSLSLLYDKAGIVKGMVGYSIDISRRKKAEAETQRRTNELALANEELGRFNYSVSHDLKAPLRAIDGFSSIILQDYNEILNDEGKDYLNRIRGAAQRMGQIIEDMLNLSRVSLEEMNKEEVSLSQISADVSRLLRERSVVRNVDMIIQPDMLVLADAGLMRILVENLLGNAWKYTSQKDNATIEFGSALQNKEKVFYIKDDGVGFDAKYANRLFDPFQRLHTKEEFSGSGIGLATVQTIVHRHQGRIWADSQLHEGATFYFTLPD